MGATGAHAGRCFLIVMADGGVVEFRFGSTSTSKH
jgi:hypothetical protein